MQPTERKKKRKHRLDLYVCVFGGSFLITIIVSSRLAFIPNGCQMLLSHCKKKKIPCCSYHRQTTNLLFFIIHCFFCCPGVSLCPLSFVLCLSGWCFFLLCVCVCVCVISFYGSTPYSYGRLNDQPCVSNERINEESYHHVKLWTMIKCEMSFTIITTST